MSRYTRVLAFLLTGALAAGLAFGPVRVLAEETEGNPAEEEGSEEDSEEEPHETDLQDWEVEIGATELEIFDDPASETVISVSAAQGKDLKIKKWIAVEIGEDAEAAGEVDYPFSAPGDSLSTVVNGAVLAGFVGTEKDVEIYAVLDTEDGPDTVTDSVCITVHRITEEVSCDLEDLRILPGEESEEMPSVTVFLQNMAHPLGYYLDAEILGAGVEDPSVAEVSFADGMLETEGRKTGTTKAWLTYRHPDGDVRQWPFTITVAEALYDVYYEESFEDYMMLLGDRSEIRLQVLLTTEDDYREMEDDELDVLWEMKALNPEEEADDFALDGDGTSAVLSVVSEAVPGVEKQVLVTAHVFLKGSQEEIGTFSTEHGHIDAEKFFTAEDTMPEDHIVEVGESFTITPCVLIRREAGNGETTSEHDEKAFFVLDFDPSQVCVTDQNGREVEPEQTDTDFMPTEGQEDGTVYTVKRLAEEDIEITLMGAWADVEAEDMEYPRYGFKHFYLGTLEEEEEDDDDDDDPESAAETTPKDSSGTDRSGSASSESKAGADSSSSSQSKASGRTGVSKKPDTGDEADAGIWLLLAAASLASCMAAAGSLRRKKK